MLRSRIIVVVDHFIHRVTSPAGVGARTTQCADVRLLALSLIISWLILLLIVEDANRMERLWWLWPLQVIVLRSEEHTSELQSRGHLVCRLLLEKKKK